MKYTYIVEWVEEDYGYGARCLQHPNRMSWAASPEAALKTLMEEIKGLPPPTEEIIPIYHAGDVWGVTRQEYIKSLQAMLQPDGYSSESPGYPFLSGVRTADTPRLSPTQIQDLLAAERMSR